MAAIAAIRIQGFQSHTDSYVQLGNGLNVITGPSGAGKTSVLRAIKWVAFNEPQGEAFVNEKVGEAVATLYMDNGTIITKRRRKGKTSYLLQTDLNDEGSLFEKSEVPHEVKQALQVEKQTFGDFEATLNFAFQLDPPFLLSETASAGAKILGKLAGTESVDLAIKGISKDTYGSRQDRTNAEKDMERLSGSMLAYAHIDDAKEAIDVAELLLEQIESNHKRFETMQDSSRGYGKAINLLDILAKRLDKLAVLPQLVNDLEGIEKAQRSYDLLLDLYASYDKLSTQLMAVKSTLTTYADVEQASDLLEKVGNQSVKLALLSSVAKEYQKYTHLYKNSADVLKNVEGVSAAIDGINDVETQMKQLLTLKTLRVDYGATENLHRRSQERLSAFEVLEETESILNGTGANLDRLTQLKSFAYDWGIIQGNVDRHKNWIEVAERDLSSSQHELEMAWEESGGVCPLCEQPHNWGTTTC